jgi:hypothetical protein
LVHEVVEYLVLPATIATSAVVSAATAVNDLLLRELLEASLALGNAIGRLKSGNCGESPA